jgi:CHAD domain-containing protein
MSLSPEIARQAIGAQVEQLREHAPGVRDGDNVEAVHRMRVAMRRLRAILRVSDADAALAEATLHEELRCLARALGEVRDVDVELAHLRKLAFQIGAAPADVAAVVHIFEARRAEAGARVQALLEAPRFPALLSGLDALTVQPWPAVEAGETPGRAVRRRYRRVRRAGGRRLDPDAAPDALHRTRIRAKKLRYTLELVAERYGKPASRLLRRVVRLQDVLGEAQDATVLEQHLRELSATLGPSHLFVLGQLVEACAEQGRAARARAPAVYQRLTGRGWKRLKRRLRPTGVLTQRSRSVNVS